MDEEQEGAELLNRQDWDETVEAVDSAVESLVDKGSSKRQAPAGDRRSFGHLWLVSYSDFMTIMMIFFLVLYGYTVLAKAKLMGGKQVMTYSEFAQSVGKLKSQLGEGLEIQEGEGRVTLRLSDKILFSSGQTNLNQNAIRSLAEIAASLKLVEGEIVVEGHTDNFRWAGAKSI